MVFCRRQNQILLIFLSLAAPLFQNISAHASSVLDCEQYANPHGLFSDLLKRRGARVHHLSITPINFQNTVVQDLNGHNRAVPGVAAAAAILREVIPNFTGESLLYPAAGFDAATPFLLLPRLRQVTAIDNHPFLLPANANVPIAVNPEGLEHPTRGFMRVDEVGFFFEMAPVILGRLALAFPRLRVLSLTLYDTATMHHGRIIFDEGPGTMLREYNHLQIIGELAQRVAGEEVLQNFSATPSAESEIEWLQAELLSQRYSALLSKGGMQFMESPLGKALISAFEKTSGALWIDADHASSRRFEQRVLHPVFYSYPPRPITSVRPLLQRRALQGFGYDNNLHLLTFP